MIPNAEERAEFERVAMLSLVAAQIAQLIREHGLSGDEIQLVLDAAQDELKAPQVATIVDVVRMRLRQR